MVIGSQGQVLALAVADTGANAIAVLWNNDGLGEFGGLKTYDAGAGAGPTAITSADLNGDGRPDLLAANGGSKTVGVLWGLTDGGFGAWTTYPVGDGSELDTPSSLAVGHVLSGTGHLDVVVGGTWCSTASCNGAAVSLLAGRGDGGFETHREFQVENNSQNNTNASAGVVLGSFASADGGLDIAVGDENGDNVAADVDVLLRTTGTGIFDTAATYPLNFRDVSITPPSLVAADLNGDGRLDLAVAVPGGFGLSVLFNQGGGTFGGEVDYSTVSPLGLATGDFNGDGLPDLAAVDGFDSSVYVMLDQRDGGLQNPVALSVGAMPVAVAVGDFNGDGLPDLAVANQGAGTLSVLLATCVPLPTCSDDSNCPGNSTGECVNFTGQGQCEPPASAPACGMCFQDWQCADGCCGDASKCVSQGGTAAVNGGFCGDVGGCSGGVDTCGWACGGQAGTCTPCTSPSQCASGCCNDGTSTCNQGGVGSTDTYCTPQTCSSDSDCSGYGCLQSGPDQGSCACGDWN